MNPTLTESIEKFKHELQVNEEFGDQLILFLKESIMDIFKEKHYKSWVENSPINLTVKEIEELINKQLRNHIDGLIYPRTSLSDIAKIKANKLRPINNEEED